MEEQWVLEYAYRDLDATNPDGSTRYVWEALVVGDWDKVAQARARIVNTLREEHRVRVFRSESDVVSA